MIIESVELRLLKLPLVRFFETSFGRVDDKTCILVRVDGDGATGWGECVAEAEPFYSSETVRTAWHILADFLVPAVLRKALAHPSDINGLMQHVRGHSMAKAALEMATWDLAAQQDGVPLSQLLGGVRSSIPSGVSIGIQNSLEELAERIALERAEGYQRVKIKIKPGWDVDAVAFVRSRFADLPLMVDANAAYTAESSERLLALDDYRLTMIEQPLDYDDIREHARLQARLRTAICLDESIVSARRADEALAIGACRVINIKPGRVGGHAASIALHDRCAAQGVPVWHGGMLETGIGRAHNVHLASLPNFSMPGDIAASKRYFDPDIVDPPFTLQSDGTVAVPTGPGLGVTVLDDRVAAHTRETLRLHA